MREQELREVIWSICQEVRMGRLLEGEASLKIMDKIKQANYVRLADILAELNGLKSTTSLVFAIEVAEWIKKKELEIQGRL